MPGVLCFWNRKTQKKDASVGPWFHSQNQSVCGCMSELFPRPFTDEVFSEGAPHQKAAMVEMRLYLNCPQPDSTRLNQGVAVVASRSVWSLLR